jgi:hypothetical protein
VKDAYWFKHDSNAKDDPKCVLLIEQLGLEGFGIYWVLIEILREQPDYHYPLALIPSIARRYNTSTQKVEAVVKGYQLFQSNDEEFFFSPSLLQRMEQYDDKREMARIAARKRWNMVKELPEKCERNADALPTHSERNARREEKRREDKSISCQLVADSWNQNVPSLPKIIKITDSRKKAIRSRSNDLAEFEDVFKKVQSSDFLSGRNGQWIGCGFDWVLKPANWTKIVEGNYTNRDPGSKVKKYVN